MNIIKSNTLLTYEPLLVFALRSEAGNEFEEYNKCITGVGKVNAVYHLARAIRERRPQIIVNLGSAGSNVFKRGSIVCCTRFVQRDMNAAALGFRNYETPLSNIDPVLNYGLKLEDMAEGICGTGDAFEMNHLSSDYNVVDMEAYALAFVAMKEQIPFLCLKYISDGADGKAAADWTVQVHRTAVAFKKIINSIWQVPKAH